MLTYIGGFYVLLVFIKTVQKQHQYLFDEVVLQIPIIPAFATEEKELGK